MTLSVIGAGFGRTGTLSLKTALEKLGFAKCYHMMQVRHHPDHAALWRRATDGLAVDWDKLFRGYKAAVDWPSCSFWRELAAHYPQAKIILTVRDPQRWYESVQNTIYPTMLSEGDDAATMERRKMARKLILENTFAGQFEDRARTIGVFEQHIETVKQTIAPQRLLVFEVARGWQPLCDFLNVAIPDEPFPKTNSTAEFHTLFPKNKPQHS